jgi:hypothetical protein
MAKNNKDPWAKAKKVQAEWEKKVEKNKANCYIKPTRYMHSSGFRCFEVGYCELGKNNRVTKKLVLGSGSDHIYLSSMQILVAKQGIPLSMDLTRDGYIRLWSTGEPIVWNTINGFVVSSADLVTLTYRNSRRVI